MFSKISTAFEVQGRDFDPDRLQMIFEVLRSPALDLYDSLHAENEVKG